MPKAPLKPLEQVVKEVGRFPIDAFVFVQNCISAAAEQVHGPVSPDEALVAQWMCREEIDLDELRRRCDAGQLPEDVARALEQAGGPEKMNRHVTGQQLCWAVRAVALKKWGLMARSVLAKWNVNRTEDIGAIIFALVENDWLQKQPADRIEDFDGVYSFEDVFDQDYRIGGS